VESDTGLLLPSHQEDCMGHHLGFVAAMGGERNVDWRPIPR
jgi:hypothetical protein